MRDPFPALSGKNSRRSCRLSRGVAHHRIGESNSRLVPPFQDFPRYLSPFQRNLFSLHWLDFTPRIDTHHGGTWDSPVGKPCGKASRESHRSLDPRDGKRDTAATAREESARACTIQDEDLLPWGDSRNTPRSMSALERNPQFPAPTPHKVLGPGIEWRRIPRGR